ncbi:MAG: DUF4358 domain-containing protein [Oscillospiraceae bacterium]|nr:DUF4358 domain-containing protein [Oscillospiraceae bacterium]
MYRTKRRIAGAFAVTFMVFALAGCKKDSNENVKTSKPVSEITAEVIDCGIEFPEMVEVSEDNFQFRYNLEDGDYSEYSVWWAGSGGDADEICLIKAEDTQKVKKAVEERIESQKGVFKDYVKEQYDKLCDAEINTKGNYVYWICTNDNKKAENIILSYFE